MVRPGRDRPTRWVEVDETFIGGLEEGKKGREKERKALVVIAAEVDGPGIGCIRLRMIPDASAESLHAFVSDSIEPGSTVLTDGWSGYSGLEAKGYERHVTIIGKRQKELPSSFRACIEYTFRFNCRKSKSRGKLCYGLMQQAVATLRPPRTR